MWIDGVELAVEPGREVVAGPLGLRAVDHTDRPLEPRFGQHGCGVRVGHRHPEASRSEPLVDDLVEQVLVALGQSRPHGASPRRLAPVRRRGHLAVVGRQPDQCDGVLAVALAGELSDVELTARAHPRGAGVADVRVVFPDHDLGATASPVEVVEQGVERRGHVPIPQVPRRDVGAVHLLVVLLGVAHHDGVLFGAEQLVLGQPAIALGVLRGLASQRDQLGDDLVLAGNRPLVRQGEAVGLALGADVVEARIPRSGALRLVGIDRVEVRDDRFDRGPQAVEVEPVEARHAERIGDPVVPLAQPVDELDHLGVAPHPGREASEVAQRFARRNDRSTAPSRSG